MLPGPESHIWSQGGGPGSIFHHGDTDYLNNNLSHTDENTSERTSVIGVGSGEFT
jgi:hypothetical protein